MEFVMYSQGDLVGKEFVIGDMDLSYENIQGMVCMIEVHPHDYEETQMMTVRRIGEYDGNFAYTTSTHGAILACIVTRATHPEEYI